MSAASYHNFLADKANVGCDNGIDSGSLPQCLFDFQKYLVDWSLRKGRAALFADCGLGKTLMQLIWAEKMAEHTDSRVVILTPLAVSRQTLAEAVKFGLSHDRFDIINYEKLHHISPADYGAVVCDESSILKSFNGSRRNAITQFMRKIPYRLLATATAAPNDWTELGTSSEALGYLGHVDMLGRFFKNDNNNVAQGRMYGEAVKWLLKPHAETGFWRWVSSWAMACRRPSDLGFEDNGFVLPPLNVEKHVINCTAENTEMLFDLPAVNLHEQRAERRRSLPDRVRHVAEIANSTDNPVLVFCHLNEESSQLTSAINGAVEVAGSHSLEQKEDRLIGFANGDYRVLVTKPKIGGWGLNFQHCAHVITFPSHSYEAYYQSVRRCWRFGQTKPVKVDVVMTEGDLAVMQNQDRKSRQADAMFTQLMSHMGNAQAQPTMQHETKIVNLPEWTACKTY